MDRDRAQCEMSAPVTRLQVYYQDDHEPALVGGLAKDARGVVHFQYERSWIETTRELSPLRLPLSRDREVVPAPDRARLHGLHGLFADSLPDAWGMRLLDLWLLRHGVDPRRAGPLDRLAHLGERTMGALTYRRAAESTDRTARVVSLDRLAAQAEQVYEGRSTTEAGHSDSTTPATTAPSDLDDLECAVGSAGGAQPKALIALSADGTSMVAGGEPPHGYSSYLLKFTPRRAGLGLTTDAGSREQAFALMARAAGVEVPPTRLFPTADGRLHFAAQRFDRTVTGGRRHVHTFGGMMEREADDAGDYDELFRLTRALTDDVRPLEEVLRRLSFNLAALNDDDHLKNVAFLLDPRDGWRLAPAYDLTYSPSWRGERGMSVNGMGAEVTWNAVAALAGRHGIGAARVRDIRAGVEESVSRWTSLAEDAQVPAASVEELATAFAGRRALLER